MAKPTPGQAAAVPAVLRQHNQTRFQRTVQLTQQAIAALEAQGQAITLMALAAATRTLDESGQGITAKSILHNPEACALFHQHSPAYQERQRRVKPGKRPRGRPRVENELRIKYRGLHVSDLIRMVETLQSELADLKSQQAKLEATCAEALRVRDEALQENVRQLAMLTAQQKSCSSSTAG